MLQMEDCNGNISMVAKANNSIGTFICIPDELSLQGLANEKKTTRFAVLCSCTVNYIFFHKRC